MLKQGIALLLCGIAGQAWSANIIVTTTEDVVKADNECSLREAVEYVNQGLPKAGYNGCGGEDSSSVIYLSSKEYKLNSQITISKTVTIKTDYDTALTDNVLGKKNAVIKMVGTDRIFNLDRKANTTVNTTEDGKKDALIDVLLYEVSLNGCDATLCKDQGGLIYNKESLTIQYGQLLNGKAKQGGAIYTVGTTADDEFAAALIDSSLIQGNQAQQGGVIYSEIPQYTVTKSVIRDNSATASDGSLFYAATGFSESDSAKISSSFIRGIQSSSIFNNKGYIIRVMDGVMVNSVTMVLNSKGLIIDAPYNYGTVANSILANNGSEDCKVVAGGKADRLSNNLYAVGCAGTLSQALGNTQLIASSNAEGECDIASDGILCPFKPYDGYTLGYFRPRLLVNYKTLADSLVVNKGPSSSGDIMACDAADQREKTRPSNDELCDRGAIELIVDRTTVSNVGADILYGEKGKFSIANQLVDGELLSPSQCQTLFGDNPHGQAWQAGCLKIVQTNTPSKGSFNISQDGDMVYTPNGDWHGSDEFKILVVTSTTRFSDSLNPYIEIPGKIVQDPPNTFKDYKVKTSGGAWGFAGILGLLGLIGLRRIRR